MSTLRVDTITDEAGTGPVEFTNGINVSGGTVTGVDPLKYNAVSGATQALDLGSYNFFDAGTLTADTTVSFSNVPTEARWSYSFEVDSDMSTASYTGAGNLGFLATTSQMQSISFKPDGTKLYSVSQNREYIYGYDLITPWDVRTTEYNGERNTSSVAALGETSPRDLRLSSDGTKMYIIGGLNKRVYQFNLITPWSITAATLTTSFSVNSQETNPYGLFFKPDGTKMYIVGNTSDAVHQYTLSTAWDVSTASYDSVSFSVSSQTTAPNTLAFTDDGLRMYVGVGSSVFSYSLSTAWDVSTASYDSISYSTSNKPTTQRGLYARATPDELYVVGSDDEVYQYELGVAYSVTLPTSVENPPSEVVYRTQRVTYDFFTADGGTTVTTIGEETT